MNATDDANTTPELDPVLHQPVRTRLVAYLAARGDATFSELKNALEITDGNLDAHIRKLSHAGYLDARKQRTRGRQQTLYSLSDAGRQAFGRYVEKLNALLNPGGDEQADAVFSVRPRPV